MALAAVAEPHRPQAVVVVMLAARSGGLEGQPSLARESPGLVGVGRAEMQVGARSSRASLAAVVGPHRPQAVAVVKLAGCCGVCDA